MASPIPIDPYEVLGVSKSADLAAIRAAHRKLALKHHPDRIKDESQRKKGTEEFQKAQQAYEILSDDKKRARYDDQVKLAQLRREAMERGGPTRSTSFPMSHPAAPHRTTSSTAYEYARTYENGRMYEERRPRYSSEEDRYPEPARSPRSSRKPSYSERKSSNVHPEEKRKRHTEKTPAGFASFVESKLREKAQRARERTTSHADAAKARDRDRRRETFEKTARRTAYAEDYDSSSDSDTIRPSPRPEPPRRSKTYMEETPRRRQASPPRRRYVSEPSSSDSSDDDEDGYDPYPDTGARRHQDALNYIAERAASGRPQLHRYDSEQYYVNREKSAGRKSGDDKEDRPRSSRAKAEVVDPPRKSPQPRKPPMKSAQSSPATLKNMVRESAPQPQRSATAEYPEHRRPVPGMKRADSMPVPTPSRKHATSSKGSKLKQSETHDSGYGSSGPNTPELHGSSPPKKSTRTFFVVEPENEYSRSRAVPLTENYRESRRTRSPSPLPAKREKDKDRKRQERPTVQSNPSYRSTSYNISSDQSSRPSFPRTDSARRSYEDSPKDSYRVKPESVRYSPQVNGDNVRYARHGKSDFHSRDYYPGSMHTDNIHAPKNGRRESAY